MSSQRRPVGLAALAAQVVERTVEVAEVPSPTGGEAERREVLARWWCADGLQEVATDSAGNLWARAAAGSGPAVVLAAHLDTVFPAEADHTVTRSQGRLVGPGVGDDGVALAALSAVARLLAEGDVAVPVLLLATVGEEGLGDLRGARQAISHPPQELAALVAVEGNYLGRIGTIGVGSRRWRVVLAGPGGHAWEQSEAPSTVHEAARLVHRLSAIPTEAGRSSLNVGTVAGGEAISARARRTVFQVDLRAAEPELLDALETEVRSVLQGPLAPGLVAELTAVGDRPAGRLDPGHPLGRAAKDALEARSIPWREVASSTDANAAHAAGVPALALGVTLGSGEHTLEEWIETEPVAAGLAALADTVLRFGDLLVQGAGKQGSAGA